MHYLRRIALRKSKRDTLRKYQRNLCCWCGQQMQYEYPDRWDYETIEHLKPRAQRGTSEITNLALAHKRCNEERGTQDRRPLMRVAR